MAASKHLNLEPATMRDILRNASARSIISMQQQDEEHVRNEGQNNILDLKHIFDISTQIAYPAPLMDSVLSTMGEWHDTHSQTLSADSCGGPSSRCSQSDGPDASQSKNILVVGLGIMGLRMALSLNKAYHVTGHDINRERLHDAESASLPVVSDITTTIDEVDCILFVLEKSQQILDVLEKVSTQLKSRQRSLSIITHTTMSASSSIEIRDRLLHLNKSITYLEAPVSGGPTKAESGQLLVRQYFFQRNSPNDTYRQ